MAHVSDTVMLWRPTGPEELALVEVSGWREWPLRLPGQPIFYPVLNEEYAAEVARDWNVPRSGAGYVMERACRTAIDLDATSETDPTATLRSAVMAPHYDLELE